MSLEAVGVCGGWERKVADELMYAEKWSKKGGFGVNGEVRLFLVLADLFWLFPFSPITLPENDEIWN